MKLDTCKSPGKMRCKFKPVWSGGGKQAVVDGGSLVSRSKCEVRPGPNTLQGRWREGFWKFEGVYPLGGSGPYVYGPVLESWKAPHIGLAVHFLLRHL
jgi:hypothetical protein